MPKDYKNVNKGKKQNPRPFLASLVSFLTGLSIGLFIALLVYLDRIHLFENIGLPDFLKPEPALTGGQEVKPQPEPAEQAPSPTFDFYKILPNKEINISEYVADEQQQESRAESEPDDGIYVLQVGSFREFESADRLKAELALLGIDPDIQRVVINGDDVRYRVRVGPYKSPERLQQTRRKLRDNNLDFMLLKLKPRKG